MRRKSTVRADYEELEPESYRIARAKKIPKHKREETATFDKKVRAWCDAPSGPDIISEPGAVLVSEIVEQRFGLRPRGKITSSTPYSMMACAVEDSLWRQGWTLREIGEGENKMRVFIFTTKSV